MTPTSGLPARIGRGILDLLFPPACALCRVLLPADAVPSFCATCLAELGPEALATCPRCAATLGPYGSIGSRCGWCQERSFRFDAVHRLGTYAGARKEAVLRMKNLSGADLAEALGRHWAGVQAPLWMVEPIHCVIPVPLHWRRRWQRGYNQAEALARALAGACGFPCRSHWLARVRHTPAQHLLSPSARRANVQGAFHARKRPELAGATVLLVDDVLTTGTTCSEAARALRDAGVRKVIVAVVARAEP